MEYWGNFHGFPIEKCLDEVKASTWMILVLGWRHGSTPRGCKRSFTEREYAVAKQIGIPISVFLTDDQADAYRPPSNPNPRIRAFRDSLLSETAVQFFRLPQELGYKVAIALSLAQRAILNPGKTELSPDVLMEHNTVLQLCSLGNYKAALSANNRLIRRYPHSPRARFNQACIKSRLALIPDYHLSKPKLFESACLNLALALKSGFLDLFAHPEIKPLPNGVSPIDRVILEPDLAPLFRYYPNLEAEVRKNHAITWLKLKELYVMCDSADYSYLDLEVPNGGEQDLEA